MARVGLGAAALLRPRLALRPWVGEVDEGAGEVLLARSLGGRDAALGIGALLALRHGHRARGWVEGAALADLVDALVTARYFSGLPKVGRWAVLMASAGAAGLGVLLAKKVDAGP